MASITIQVNGLAQFERALARSNPVVTKEIKGALFRSSLALQGRVKEYAPVKTGTLRRSITAEVKDTTAIVGTNLKYAPMLEFGTKAHGPVTAKFLVFKGNDGKMVMTKRVKGIAARRFFQRAIADTSAAVAGYFDDAVRNVLSFLSH